MVRQTERHSKRRRKTNKTNRKRGKRPCKKHNRNTNKEVMNQDGGMDAGHESPIDEEPVQEEWLNYTREMTLRDDNIGYIFEIMNKICIMVGEGIDGFNKSVIRAGINHYSVRIYYSDEEMNSPIAIVLYKSSDRELTVHYICALRGNGYGYNILCYDLPMNVAKGNWPRTIYIDKPIGGAINVYKIYGFIQVTDGDDSLLSRIFNSQDECKDILTEKISMMGKTRGVSNAFASERQIKLAKAEAERKQALDSGFCECINCGKIFKPYVAPAAGRPRPRSCPDYCYDCVEIMRFH
jgi:hypothetical protein